MKLIFVLFNLLSLANIILANADAPKTRKQGYRTGRASLITFQPFGKSVNVGLDLLLPFVKIPTKRRQDENGRENVSKKFF